MISDLEHWFYGSEIIDSLNWGWISFMEWSMTENKKPYRTFSFTATNSEIEMWHNWPAKQCNHTCTFSEKAHMNIFGNTPIKTILSISACGTIWSHRELVVLFFFSLIWNRFSNYFLLLLTYRKSQSAVFLLGWLDEQCFLKNQ